MLNSEELIETIFVVCSSCKEGKCADSTSPDVLADFVKHHNTHGGTDTVVGREFVTKYLADGFIDVDRPDLKPLVQHVGEETRKTGQDPPFGAPGGAAGARTLQKAIRRDVMQPPESGETPTIVLRPNAPPQRDPSLRELQLCLPWTVKYSRDFRANPQAHKDFTHALLHAGKALGKLMAIADDFDHRRSSEESERTRDYLADLVICAMRAANTMPGGTIDLLPAVQNRVITKNPPSQDDHED